MGSGPEEPYGRERLGGPPGLYDSPNLDRESNGGIVQRMRVPPSPPPDPVFAIGRFQMQSLNDAVTLEDMGKEGAAPGPKDTVGPSRDELEHGIPYRRSISGRNT